MNHALPVMICTQTYYRDTLWYMLSVVDSDQGHAIMYTIFGYTCIIFNNICWEKLLLPNLRWKYYFRWMVMLPQSLKWVQLCTQCGVLLHLYFLQTVIKTHVLNHITVTISFSTINTNMMWYTCIPFQLQYNETEHKMLVKKKS